MKLVKVARVKAIPITFVKRPAEIVGPGAAKAA